MEKSLLFDLLEIFRPLHRILDKRNLSIKFTWVLKKPLINPFLWEDVENIIIHRERGEVMSRIKNKLHRVC